MKVNVVKENELTTNERFITKYSHNGHTAYGSLYGEEHNISNPYAIIESINEKAIINDLDIDISIIPMKLNLYVDEYTLGSSYYGQAFYDDDMIFVGAVGSIEDIETASDTLIHEIGHFVTRRDIMTSNEKYEAFKGLIGRHDDKSILWHLRPKEFLAEYFTKFIRNNYEPKVEFIQEAYDFMVNNIQKRSGDVNKPDKYIIHHAAGSHFSYEQCVDYHKSKGWRTCGYHYYIQKDGQVFQARQHDEEGCHTKGQNLKSIGICFEGHFDKEVPSQLQMDAGRKLLARLYKDVGEFPLVPHNRYANKTCPGNFFYDLNRLTNEVKAMNKPERDEWQKVVLDDLVKNDLINSPEYWLNKWDENITVKDAIGLIGSLILRSKGDE